MPPPAKMQTGQEAERDKRKEKERQGILILQTLDNQVNHDLNNPDFTSYIKGKYTDDQCNLHENCFENYGDLLNVDSANLI